MCIKAVNYLLVQDLLHDRAQVSVLLGIRLALRRLLLVLWQLQALLGHGHQLLAIELLQLLHTVLVNWLRHVHNLEATLLDLLHKRGLGNGITALASDVVDVLLVLLHATHVILKAGLLISRRTGMVSVIN